MSVIKQPTLPFLVKGAVRSTDGQPILNAIVRAFDRDMRKQQLLGETKTDADGHYEIRYGPEGFAQAEKRSADLVVSVLGDKGATRASSQTLFNAGPEEQIDLVVGGAYRGPSEYTQLMAELAPLLQGIAITDLVEDDQHQDVTFLSGETGLPREWIKLIMAAHRLVKETTIRADAFYGLFRGGLPTDLPALLARGQAAQRRALEAAVRDNIIPADLAKSLEQILMRLQELKAEQPVFLARPEALYRPVKDLLGLPKPQAGHIIARLNDQLREEIRKAIGPLDDTIAATAEAAIEQIDFRSVSGGTLAGAIRTRILAGLHGDGRLTTAVAAIERHLSELPPTTIGELLQLDRSLEEHPRFADDLRRAKVAAYAQLAQLDDRATRNLLERNVPPRDLGAGMLQALVAGGMISTIQKDDLVFALDLGRLTGDNLALVEKLCGAKLRSSATLAAWSKDDWRSLLERESIALPFGETIASYADHLFVNVERTYPSHMLTSRLRSPQRAHSLEALDSLNQLLERNERLIDGTRPAVLDWGEVVVGEHEAFEPQLRALTDFANSFRHLGVTELINDKRLDSTQKQAAIAARLALLDQFFDNNPDLDLRLVNLARKGDGALSWQYIPGTERGPIKRQLMAYQRVLFLAGDTAARERLLQTGHDSAMAIVGQTEAGFINATALDPDSGQTVYARALDQALRASHTFETIRDVVRGDYRFIAASNLDPSLVNDLREIEGFDDLFGSQNYCDCEHCRSILSLAAYFVDLMYFVEKHISEPAFIDRQEEDHSLYLKNRRPGCRTLQLSCENTNTLVPYLTIVNEVLEEYLNTVVEGDNTVVEGGIYAALANRNERHSFALPSNLALEELRLYLSHFGLNLHKVYRILQQLEEKVWRARLNLSREEYEVITDPDAANVSDRFGDPVDLQHFPVSDYQGNGESARRGFINLAGISREQLTELLALQFNPDLQTISVDRMPLPDELQNFPEILENLTASHLDFIHRFIRLWKKTPWNIPELDRLLVAPNEDPLLATGIDGDTVLYLARLQDIQEKLGLNVDELCALVGLLPVSQAYPKPTARLEDRGFYERLFDLEKLFGRDKQTHKLSEFLRLGDGQTLAQKMPLLLAGLGLSETDLFLLLNLFKSSPELQQTLSSPGYFDDAGHLIGLDRRILSLLYRHARLARALKWSIEELVQALQFSSTPHGLAGAEWTEPSLLKKHLQQTQRLIEFRDWIKSSPFTISDLRFILKGEESATAKHKVNLEAVGKLVKDIQGQGGLFFGVELLADIESVSKEDSETILRQMEAAGLITSSPEGYRIDRTRYVLTQDFGPIFDASGVDADVISQEDHIRVRLNELHPFVISITSSLNIKKELFHQLIKFVSVDLGSGDFIAALQATFDEDGNPVDPNALTILLTFLKELERVLSAVDKLRFDAGTVGFITEESSVFDIADLRYMKLENLEDLAFYKKLVAQASVALGAEAEPLVQKALTGLADGVATLAELWRQDKRLIKSLTDTLNVAADTSPINVLERLWERLTLCQTLGINGHSMVKLSVDTDYSDLEAARDVGLGAFSSRYNEDTVRQEKLEPYQDRINVIKRDVLCDYIIARGELKFKDLSDIYAYFLLDVEMSDCFRTSRVVCANSSLQLYVQRVLANLEQSASDGLAVLSCMEDPATPVQELEIFKREWEWRKNYRVWEANRKVFLYPENYLEPDLRDNKTPIFKELEDELLQEKVTLEAAEAAYRKYVSQFAELARLHIAGSYYHADTNTYYFFGLTAQDPQQYYYRKWEKCIVWTPWEKIELAINAPYVTSIIHLGRLYLFWVTSTTTQNTTIEDGNSRPQLRHSTVNLHYSCLNERGKWLAPQKLKWDEWDSDTRFYQFMFPALSNKHVQVFYQETVPFQSAGGGITKCKALDLFNNTLVRLYPLSRQNVKGRVR